MTVSTTPGDHLVQMEHDGRVRSYWLHIPGRIVEAGERVPLVIMLHSAAGNGRLIAARTRMSEKADAEGFIAVYPNGTGLFEHRLLTWNGGHCCVYAMNEKVDDVGFIERLLDELERALPVDTRRVYLSGFSNGGMLAYRVAAVLSHRVAAVAAVSSTLGGSRYEGYPPEPVPEPDQPVAVMIMHGRQDAQIAYAGGRGAKTFQERVDLSVADTVAFWKRHNRCSGLPQRHITVDGEVVIERHACDAGSEVLLYTLEEGGHAWPGGEQLDFGQHGFMETFVVKMLLDDPYPGLNATDEIWEFFSRHTK